MNNFKVLKNEYYEILFPIEYEDDIKEILEYSTERLKENLKFFKEESYGEIIKASFFDKKEDFFGRIKELDKDANPPEWAEGCFYGGESQVLLKEKDAMMRFFTLAHESCHLLFTKFIYANYRERVVWLDEAFAANFSGEMEEEIKSGEFVRIVKKYLDKTSLPKIAEIDFRRNNVKTEEYNAYDFFHIIGRYLREVYSNEELLKLFKDEERVINLGEHILEDSLVYFKDKYLL